ncbi:acyltransferase family protein [Romboutsia maritimum]|nr:acyltransferase [Romboutsia maritimum]
MVSNKQQSGRIKYIDGLRGICALIVVMSHFMVAFFPSSYWGASLPSHTLYNLDTYLAQSPLSLFYAGNYAVCIFFIISGFVLSKNYYANNQKINKLATTRYLRLCIPILFSTLIIFIFMKFSIFKSIQASNITGSIWLQNLYNFNPNFGDMLKVTLFDVFFLGSGKYNTVLWMMSILFYGSFLTIFITMLWSNIKNRHIIYLILGIIFFKLNKIYYISFILGIVLSDLDTNHKNIINKITGNLYCMFMIILGIYLGCYPTGITPTNTFYSWLNIGEQSYLIYHILGAFMVVLGVICCKKIQIILSKTIFQYLGKLSFSIFLVHIIILSSFSCNIFIKVWNLTQRYQFSFIISFIPSIIIIIGFSHLFYKLIEQNLNKMVSKTYDKFFL